MGKHRVPATLLEAVRHFADEQVAHDFFADLRWPNGAGCPRCGNAEVSFMPKYRRWHCKDCRRQFTAKTGTIFEDSPIGFSKWLPAVWMLTADRNGISSCELACALGVTQKTAWFMLHRIREAMQNDDFKAKFFGPVEADETYVGGKGKWRGDPTGRKRKGPAHGKAVIMGIIERKGRQGKVRAWVVDNVRRHTLQAKIRENVYMGATIYTDSLASYERLRDFHGYDHQTVNHAIEYVRGNVHTNSIESFWSVFKRMVKGTYVAPRHVSNTCNATWRKKSFASMPAKKRTEYGSRRHCVVLKA